MIFFVGFIHSCISSAYTVSNLEEVYWMNEPSLFLYPQLNKKD